MESVNDPSLTDSDRPDYAKMRGPINCRELPLTELTSGSNRGGCLTFLRNELCVEAEQIYLEKIAPPVTKHSVLNTKVKAAAAIVETARREEIKAQADEPIEEEGNVVTTSSESEERDEANEGQADSKEGCLLGMIVQAFWLLAAAAALLLIKAAIFAINLGFAIVNIPLSEESDVPVEEEGNVVTTSSESAERDDENEGQADSKEGCLLGMLVQAFWLLVAASALLLIEAAEFAIALGFAIVNIPLSEESDVSVEEEGNVVTTSSESEERDEENEGQADNKKAWLLGMLVQAFWLLVAAAVLLLIEAAEFAINLGFAIVNIPLSEESDVPVEEEGNVVTTSSESEERDEENKGQADNKKAWLFGMLVQAFWLIIAATALLLIEAAEFAINLGFATVNIPLSEESDVLVEEEGNVVTTSWESEERDEENEGQAGNKKAWLLGMLVQAFWLLVAAAALLLIEAAEFAIYLGFATVNIPLSKESDVPIEEEGNVVTTGSELEGRDEENEWQAGISARLVKAFWILFAAALRLIKAAKFDINLGVFTFEMPLAAIWRDD